MLTLAAGAATLVLAPEIGGAVCDWQRGGLPIFRPTDPASLPRRDPRTLGSYPLVPFSNRIAGRRFTWAGITWDLPEQFGGHAIHGVGWLREWTVAEHTPTHALLTLDQPACAEWPFALRAWQRFELGEDTLVSEIGVANTDSRPWPAGLGQHPYFPKSPGVRLTMRATSVWQNSDLRIPTLRTPVPADWDHSAGRPVDGVVDHCFAGWDGVAAIDHPALGYRLTNTAGLPFRHVVYFVPDGRDFFAVEPVSHMSDAINRMATEADHGLIVLPPGGQLEGRIDYRISALSG